MSGAHSLTHALRVLRKNPGFTVSALAVLTLGIGANTAIFSVVNAVLLRPLPFPESRSVVEVYHAPPPAAFPGIKKFSVSIANFLDWRAQNDIFEAISAYSGRALPIGGGARPQSLLVTISDTDFFRVLRVRPSAGRFFTTGECQPGHDQVIVLTEGFAKSFFGSASGAVGKHMQLNGRDYEVVGIMPDEFHVKSWFPASTQAFIPVAWTEKDRHIRGNHNYLVVARLRNGVSLAKAQSGMNVISKRLAAEYPEEDKGWGAIVSPLREVLVGDVRPALLTLLGAVGFVLLIACANTANLVLARTIARRKEFAIRAALGASSRQVLQPVLLETTLLALVGGGLGLLVARSGQSLVVRALADQLPRATEVQLDVRVLVFTLAVSVLTGIAAGLLAGARLIRGNLSDSLKLGIGKSDAYSSGRRTRGILVASEVALSLMLLIGAGLMIRTLWALRGTDPGFNPTNLLTMTVPIPKSAETTRRSRFYDDFLPQIAALPGVKSVAAVDDLPLRSGSEQPIAIEGRPVEVFALQRNVSVRAATPNYFRTMGIPLVDGRDFTFADTTGEQHPSIISKAMANLFWPGEDAVGKRFRISFSPEIVRTVVGVVGDIKDRGLEGLEAIAMLYNPIRQDNTFTVSLVVRGGPSVARIGPDVARTLAKIDPTLPIRDIKPMQEIVDATLAQHRFSMWLFAALAGLAFLLAVVGIYSVLAYGIRSRVQEIGVRIALGAGPGDILRLVIAEGMRPALIGVTVGAAGALALGGILSRLVYGVSPADPLTFVAVGLLLMLVSLIACAIPGYRATRVQPVVAIRNE